MLFYIGREASKVRFLASKIWKRICTETAIEINLLSENWKYILGGLIFQACQLLRIITFYFTQLRGPNYHCCEGSKLATLPPPNSVLEVLLINFPRGMLYGCGDLRFSSHMIFSLVFVRTYHKYGTKGTGFTSYKLELLVLSSFSFTFIFFWLLQFSRLVWDWGVVVVWFIKLCAWLVVIAQSFLTVASRKHYTVDIVVAWYTVNLVVFFVDKQLPELPDRTSAPLFLPQSKDSKTKKENYKLLNGNSGDPAEWV